MEDKNKYYRFIIYEDWCDLMFTMEVKDINERTVYQIKRLSTSNVAPVNSDINDSIRLTFKKKARTGVLISHK